jgi:hypothetical protein
MRISDLQHLLASRIRSRVIGFDDVTQALKVASHATLSANESCVRRNFEPEVASHATLSANESCVRRNFERP